MDDISAILLDSDIPSPIAYERHDRLAAYTGCDFGHIIRAFKYLTFSLEGAEHVRVRRAQARLIAKAGINERATIENLILPHCERLKQPGEFDLVAEILSPIANDYIRRLTGVDIDIAQYRNLVVPISHQIGIRERVSINKEIGQLFDLIEAQFPNDPDNDLRASLIVLGNDPIHATFARSLKAVIEADDPKSLLDMSLPPITGVPTVGRDLSSCDWQASYPASLDGISYLDLSMLNGTTCPAHEKLKFGAGRHTCLGVKSATLMWQVFATYFADLDLSKFSVIEFDEREDLLVPTPYILKIRIDP